MTKERTRPYYRATDPQRIPEKIQESQFFLELMSRTEQEQTGPDARRQEIKREFLFFFSAFLCAYRSALYRLNGVVSHGEGNKADEGFWRELLSDRDIAFVKNLTDFEIHGNGITVYENVPAGADVQTVVLYPPILVQRCRIALRKMEDAARKALGVV